MKNGTDNSFPTENQDLPALRQKPEVVERDRRPVLRGHGFHALGLPLLGGEESGRSQAHREKSAASHISNTVARSGAAHDRRRTDEGWRIAHTHWAFNKPVGAGN
ncbi:MAG: hypothetical protein LAQ30_10540 [Acidobacteriia bacterium]|nr:hypothetical protein [Terriglobia bacterium]